MWTSLDEIAGNDEEDGRSRNDIGGPDLRLTGLFDRFGIEAAVHRLPMGYKLPFILHDVCGYQHNEIAENRCCSEGNSKSLLYKARKRLRDQLRSAQRDGTPQNGEVLGAPPSTKLGRDVARNYTESETERTMKKNGTTNGRLSVLLISLVFLGVAISSFPAAIFAQSLVGVKHDTPGQAIKQGSLHVAVDLALVNVTVADPHNRLVTGLEPDNFRIFEDNVEQEIVNFSSEDVPISIGVVLDHSGSMSNKLGKAKEAALQFLRTANPEDEFFLVSFNDRAELLSPITTSVQDLQSRMLSTSPAGATALLDAIYLGLTQMRSARNAKRALLIISDGGDNHSRYSQKDIKRLVREADTQLYSIGIFDSFEYRNRTLEELNGPSLLNEVTELTGGRSFTVENPNDLPDIAAKIGAELRNQYILGYRPSHTAHDARWRKIKIKLRAPKGLPPLTAYAKTGYYAPSR